MSITLITEKISIKKEDRDKLFPSYLKRFTIESMSDNRSSHQNDEGMSGQDLIEQVVEAPAEALDKTIEVSKQIIRPARDFWHRLGPGLTTGAADDDPAGIATYSQAGAQYGFQLNWVSIVTFPFMSAVQEMCARIGLTTGKGLAANIRANFPRWVLYLCTFLLFFANTFNIGADLGAMAKATQLVLPGLGFGLLLVVFTVVMLGLQIFTTYDVFARYLKLLAFILFSYVVTAFLVPGFDWPGLLEAITHPTITFSRDQIIMICAILGTTISPYLFFWQTSQEVESEITAGKTSLKARQGVTNQDIKSMRWDVWIGMFISNFVEFFIVATAAATLFASGIVNIETADDAAAALRPLAGDQASLIFALGVIGTGMLAVPVLAGSASYALSESFGWREGLNKKLRQASAFYGVIIMAMLIGFGLNFVGIPSIKALLYSAVFNGLVSPIVLVLIVLLSSNRKVMGERVNHWFTTTAGWFVAGVMALAGLATIVSLI